MTTPAGVPNLPIGALTVETLGQRLQDQSATAMRNRAGEQMPAIFGASTGGNILSDLSPFGILTKIWAEINSRIATADPVDIQGPEDIPPLLLDFIESLPVVGQFVQLLEALAGTYDGEDPTLLAIQDLLEPIRLIVGTIGQGVADFLKWIWDNFGPAVDSFLKPILEWLNWLWELFGSSVESVLNPIFQFLHWLFYGLAHGDAPPTTGNAIADALLQPLFTFLKWAWDLFGDAVESVLQPIFTFLHWVFVGLPAGNPPPSTGNAFADSVLQPLFSFLAWVWDLFGDAVESVLQPIFEFLHWVFTGLATGAPPPTTGNAIADALLQPVFSLIKSVWDLFSNAATGIGETASTLLHDLFDFLNWLWNGVSGGFAGFAGTVDSILKPVIEWLSWLWSLFGDIAGDARGALEDLFINLQKLLKANGSIKTWIDQIPLVGPLVSIITGKTPADGVAMDLSTLGMWANDVLTKTTQLPAANLIGSIPQALLSSIPLSNINFTTPNLLAQGDFGTSATIDAASGWTWDSTIHYPDGGSGGSAKVTCNSTTRTLYSNQVIKVAAGDKLNMSAWVKSSSTFSGSGTSIVIGLVPFIGTSQQSAVPFASRGSTSASWAQMAGAGSYAPWTVPAGITSVRPYLQVGSSTTAGSVNFDTISLTKSGLLSGEWMQGIMGTVAADFQSIVDKVIQAIKGTVTGGTGNPLTGILTSMQSIFSTLFNIPQLPTSLISNPLLESAIPGLQATKITSGTFGTDYIATDAITTDKIATDAVTQNELAVGSVGSPEIINGSVTGGASGELATNTVVSVNVSNIDGSKIQSGKVNVDYLPTGDIGAKINPGSGSGAVITRLSTTAYKATPSRNQVGNDFYDTAEVSPSADVQIVMSGSQYTGAFKALTAGWYEVIIGYGLKRIVSNGYSMAPLLYKGSSLASLTPYKVGSEAWATSGAWTRYCQGVFTVYLNVNDYVRAGYDAAYGNITDPNDAIIKADNTGVENYFSIALLNRSYV